MGLSRGLAILIAALLCGAPAFAESPKDDLSRIEKSLKEEQKRHEDLKRQSEALSRDVQTVKKKMVRTASRVQRYEENLTQLEQRLAELQKQQRGLQTAIDRRSEQMVTVIAALQRLAWRPTEALIAQPTPPSDTVRSAILLRTAVPAIEASARELKHDLDRLSSLRAQVKGQKDRITAVAGDLSHTHDEMKALFSDKAALQQQTEQASEDAMAQMQTLTREASDLKDLIARLEAERARQREEARKQAALRAQQEKNSAALQRTAKLRPQVSSPAQAPRGFGNARGKLPLPAVGEITQKYGQLTQAGIHAKGITIATRSRAQIITPSDGVVLFAGPFRGYGRLLIIEYGDGYHILLARMERIDAAVGQSLLVGEPVGVMTDTNAPELYVELRHEGQPINPLPWLTAGKGKGQG